MPNVTINERLAQLINEKNMGLKASSVADIASTQDVESVETVRYAKQDSVEIKGPDSDDTSDTPTKMVASKQVTTAKKVNTDGNPFIHNQVVDDIAKKMLKAFTGG